MCPPAAPVSSLAFRCCAVFSNVTALRRLVALLIWNIGFRPRSLRPLTKPSLARLRSLPNFASCRVARAGGGGGRNGWGVFIRIVRGHRHARVLRAGGSQSLLCPGVRGLLRAGFDLWILAGRLAIWPGRGDLGRRGVAAVDAQVSLWHLAWLLCAVLG